MEKREELIQRLQKRTVRVLPAGWRKDKLCPSCGVEADRPKCMWDIGPTCPRLDPDEYEPSPYIERPDADCAAAADALREAYQELDDTQIYGFYEEQYPIYTNLQHACSDLSSPMTVEEANGLVSALQTAHALLETFCIAAQTKDSDSLELATRNSQEYLKHFYR